MCGIAGIWNFDGRQVQTDTIVRFTDSLKHRGPDGRGIWHSQNNAIAFGHRRLAIIDLSSAADQPLQFAEGRYTIVFNGEIFNFIEIRDELSAKGYKFKTDSDTEVILAAYHKWGQKMLKKFNGMWAICIYDSAEDYCFIARDRFGIKPFHYTITSNRFAFASELKAFRSLDDFIPEIDERAAAHFLKTGFGVEHSSFTLFKHVHKLKAGECGIVKQGKIELHTWWNTLDNLVAVPETLAEQAEQFRELFYDAVKLRMRSDVPVGSSLSGGFDSSAVVCALAECGRNAGLQRMSKEWQQTFVASFPGKSNDERPQAEQVVNYAGVKAHYFNVHEHEALEILEKVLYDFDDVYVGMPVAPWLIYRELRRNNVVVSLDGHGADELLGGYVHADGAWLSNAPSWFQHPKNNLNVVNELLAYTGKSKVENTITALRQTWPSQVLYHPDFKNYRKVLSAYKHSKDRYKPSYWQQFINTDLYELEFPEDYGNQIPEHLDEVNQKLYRMFHFDVLPTILRNFDRMSMAHGIEVRMPFMDWRLVCYAFSLSGNSKINNGYAKLVAREAMKNRMPESIRASRVKIGFNAPMPEWFSGPVYPWLMQQLEQPSALIDTKLLKTTVERINKQQSWDWTSTGNVWKYVHYLWYENNFLKSA
jgi:asparagine synthase (glutamine-hydrolysing)